MSKKVLKLAGRQPMLLALIVMATFTLALLFSGWLTPTPGKAQNTQQDPQPQIETTCTPNWGDWQVSSAPAIYAYGLPTPVQWLVGNTLQISAACDISTDTGTLVQYDQNNCCSPNYEDDELGTITNVWTASGCGATPSSGTNTTGAANFTVNTYGTVTITYNLSGTDALNQQYTATASANINVLQLKHTCRATAPVDKTRTTIGIGEIVDFEVDGVPSDDSGVTYWWMVYQNSGDDDGSLSQYNTQSMTYTAPIIDAPATETMSIYVDVYDPDSNISGHQQIQYTVLTPTGLTPSIQNDGHSFDNTNIGKLAPPNNYIACETFFQMQYSPSSVNFDNVKFRENIPYQTWSRPDNSLDYQQAEKNLFFLDSFSSTNVNTVNAYIDDCGDRGESYHFLASGSYQNFIENNKVPVEYFDDNQNWVICPPSNKSCDWRVQGSNQKSQELIHASGSLNGGYMGPWQSLISF